MLTKLKISDSHDSGSYGKNCPRRYAVHEGIRRCFGSFEPIQPQSFAHAVPGGTAADQAENRILYRRCVAKGDVFP